MTQRSLGRIGVLAGACLCAPIVGSSTLAGRPDRVVDRFFADGSLASRETYRAGRKVGVHWAFWPDGTARRRASYGSDEAADAYDGMVRTWDETGRARDIRRYARGREHGVQQSFGPNGEIFLNYEARNGRRFGLVNSTPCLGVGSGAQATGSEGM